MKATLIVLMCVAVALGIAAYFAVFSGTQFIEPNSGAGGGGSAGSTTPMLILTSSSTSSTTAGVGGSSSTFITNAPPSSGLSQVYQSIFAAPYPVTWTEGQPQFAISGMTLQGNQLSVIVNVETGASIQCVPVNLRLITDEQGDMAAPSAPASPNFLLGGDGTCTPTANTAYPNQIVTFEVDPTQMPFLITTGGTSNVFFEVTTSTNNGLQVAIPQSSG